MACASEKPAASPVSGHRCELAGRRYLALKHPHDAADFSVFSETASAYCCRVVVLPNPAPPMEPNLWPYAIVMENGAEVNDLSKCDR
jgi:hypothetical protein